MFVCCGGNERKVFYNTSLKSGKKVFSLYSKQSKIPIFSDDEWREDDWDALQYGLDYDFQKPFFQQYHELVISVPHWGSSCEPGNLRSDFVVNSDYAKDCYLISNTTRMEACAYCNASDSCRECFDLSNVSASERSYELFWCSKCYRTHFSSQCDDCTNVLFSKNCKGCVDCFGCISLKNKKFCILNKQHTKEEYEELLLKIKKHMDSML